MIWLDVGQKAKTIRMTLPHPCKTPMGKVPTIKALNTEYAELLAEKKAAYADYRKAREEMKELLTAKANIDRILELDKEHEEANERREKEAEQR